MSRLHKASKFSTVYILTYTNMLNFAIILSSTFLLPLFFLFFLTLIHFYSLSSSSCSSSDSSIPFDPFSDPRLIQQESAILRAYLARHIDDTFPTPNYDADDDHEDFPDNDFDLDETLYINDDLLDDDNHIWFDDNENNEDAEECWERMKMVVLEERPGSPGINGKSPGCRHDVTLLTYHNRSQAKAADS
jgi:hypothetical protein